MTKQCDTCDRHSTKSKPTGQKSIGVTTGQLLHHVSSLNLLPMFTVNKPLQRERFSEPPFPIMLDDFLCKACANMADQPVESVCGNLCCKACLCNWLQESSTTPSCPCYSMPITNASDVRKAPEVVRNIIP